MSALPLTKPHVQAYLASRGIKVNGAGRCPCPIHQGTRDSFHIDLATGQWYCHSQCARGGGLPDLEAGLFNLSVGESIRSVKEICGISEDPPAKPALVQSKSKPVSTKPELQKAYDYTDEQGVLLFQVLRYRCADTWVDGSVTYRKEFRQRRPDGHGGWICNLKGVRRVLYRLPELLAAETVFIVEGEKDADALNEVLLSMGDEYVATCNPMGAGKWDDSYSEFLRGKNVAIIADDDKPGRSHAVGVAESVIGAAMLACCFTLPAKDLSAFLKEGGTVEQLFNIANAAPPLDSASISRLRAEWLHSSQTAQHPKIQSAASIMAREFPEPTPVIDGLLVNGLTFLAGRPKIGKSWMTLSLALDIAEGTPALDYAKFKIPRPRNVLYIALEESARRTQSRMKKFTSAENPALNRLFFVYSMPGIDDGFVDELAGLIDDSNAEVVIVDTLLALRGDGGNRKDILAKDYSDIKQLTDLAKDRDIAVVIVHHTRKMAADYGVDAVAGTTGLTASADAIWTLGRSADGNCKLEITGRDLEAAEFTVRLQNDEGDFGWRVVGEGDTGMSEQRERILEALKAGPAAPKEIGRRLGKRSYDSIRHLVRRMAKDGLLVQSGEGKYEISRSQCHTFTADTDTVNAVNDVNGVTL